MIASLDTLVVAGYVFACSLSIPRPGPQGLITDQELIAEGQVRLVDGTLISCANYPGCAKRSEFAPNAADGYCPSKSQFVWGMCLVVICDRKGVPVGYDLVGPKTGQERVAPGECPP